MNRISEASQNFTLVLTASFHSSGRLNTPRFSHLSITISYS